MTNAPLVSVIIPTWNRCTYLAETIDSVLAQDHPAVEVIVVNDGSTDATAESLARYEGKITAIHQPNSGQGAAVNRGFAAARGEYLTLVSDDDPLLSGALSQLVDALECERGALVAYPDWAIIDSEGARTALITGFEYSLVDMARHHLCYPGPCTLFRRGVLDLVGGWDTKWRWVADFDFWLRIGLHGPMVRVPKVLATWRRHDEAATRAAPRLAMAREQVAVIEAFFARTDLPPEVRAVEREAVASAWAVAAVIALEGLEPLGVPRFRVSDRLSHYVERPLPVMRTRNTEQLASRLEELEALVQTHANDRATMRRHIEVLERHLALFGVYPGEVNVDE
ncbi:MAG: glycosyltransferase [Thermoanaerobaculia bacterium]|jgi:hypothetical protein